MTGGDQGKIEGVLYISEGAAEELAKKLGERDAGARVRVFVDRLCNCGRPRFGLRLDDTAAKGDTRFDAGGLPFVADQETAPRLEMVVIEYVNSWMQRGVIARNIDECGSCVDA